jgi:hypothetical protein
MTPYRLWYLDDQTASGPDGIYDSKSPCPTQFLWDTLANAQAQAVTDGIAHYSVELDRGDGITFDIVYVI